MNSNLFTAFDIFSEKTALLPPLAEKNRLKVGMYGFYSDVATSFKGFRDAKDSRLQKCFGQLKKPVARKNMLQFSGTVISSQSHECQGFLIQK
jgi:hypothetical protein